MLKLYISHFNDRMRSNLARRHLAKKGDDNVLLYYYDSANQTFLLNSKYSRVNGCSVSYQTIALELSAFVEEIHRLRGAQSLGIIMEANLGQVGGSYVSPLFLLLEEKLQPDHLVPFTSTEECAQRAQQWYESKYFAGIKKNYLVSGQIPVAAQQLNLYCQVITKASVNASIDVTSGDSKVDFVLSAANRAGVSTVAGRANNGVVKRNHWISSQSSITAHQLSMHWQEMTEISTDGSIDFACDSRANLALAEPVHAFLTERAATSSREKANSRLSSGRMRVYPSEQALPPAEPTTSTESFSTSFCRFFTNTCGLWRSSRLNRRRVAPELISDAPSTATVLSSA